MVNLVDCRTESNGVASPGSSAVVASLFVVLLGLLWRLGIGPAGESRAACKVQAESGGRIENAGSSHGVHNLVGIAVVGKAKAVDIRSAREVETDSVPIGVIATLERLEVAAAERIDVAALVVSEAVEQLRSGREFVIQAARDFGLVKRGAVASVKNVEGRVENRRSVEILSEILSGQKVEQFVLFP